MYTHNGKLVKEYPSSDWCHLFFDYCGELYCKNKLTGEPQQGFLRNSGDLYYFQNGKAITGTIIRDGHKYSFDKDTYLGHMIY